jgi:hypothetical protein
MVARKRRKDESFKDYKLALKVESAMLKNKLKPRVFYSGAYEEADMNAEVIVKYKPYKKK